MAKPRSIRGYLAGNRGFRLMAGAEGRSYARTALIFLAWLSILLIVNWREDSIFIPDGIGFLEDVVMVFLLVMLFVLIFLTRPLINRFEELLEALPAFVAHAPSASSGRSSSQLQPRASYMRKRARSVHDYFLPSQRSTSNLDEEIAAMRSFLSLRTPASRRFNRLLIILAVLFVAAFQVLMPIVDDTGDTAPATRGDASVAVSQDDREDVATQEDEDSQKKEDKTWALWPRRYPGAFLGSILWSSFWMIVVVRSVAWYPIAICLVLFPMLRGYSKQERITVQPVAPDGKGGLASVGRLSLAITLVASSGLLLAIPWIIIFPDSLAAIIGFPTYLMFLTALFFLPLLSVHEAMSTAKMRELDKWSRRFRTACERMETKESDGCNDAQNPCQEPTYLLSQLQCMEAIEHVYARAEAMPVWPSDWKTLRQFSVVVLVPLLIFVIQLFIEKVLIP